jgi:hypothetical protein
MEENKRQCGKCFACCYVGEIIEIGKSPYAICPHANGNLKENHCKIYDTRPKSCSGFECAWKRGFGREEDRPDLSNVLTSVNDLNGGTYSFVVELRPHALFMGGRNIVVDMVCKLDFPAIVSNYGVKPPHDTGDRVVVKASLLDRSRGIRSTFLNALSDDIGVYLLKDNPRTIS